MQIADIFRRRIERCESIEDVAELLDQIVASGIRVLPDGSTYETRQLAGRVRGLRILVYTRDHQPPHFHVVGSGVDVKMRIADATIIDGELRRTSHDEVIAWFFALGGRERVLTLWERAHGPALPNAGCN